MKKLIAWVDDCAQKCFAFRVDTEDVEAEIKRIRSTITAITDEHRLVILDGWEHIYDELYPGGVHP